MYQYIKMPLACLLILAYTFMYYRTKKRLGTRTAKAFEWMAYFAIVHLISAVVTEYTVNNRDRVPEAFNYVWHVVFLVSVTGVCWWLLYYLFLYVERGSGVPNRMLKQISLVVCCVGAFLEIVLPISYVDTVYGSYSYGPKVYALYGVALYTMLMMLFLIVRDRQVLDTDKSRVLVISVVVFIVAGLVQMFCPHMLITYLAVTMIMLGILVNTEDSNRYISYRTGLYNKLGSREIMQELLLVKKPFKIGVYVFLGGSRNIENAMISVKKQLPESKCHVICGVFADNVLIVLPMSRIDGKSSALLSLPEPVLDGEELHCTKEIVEFTGQESVAEIRNYLLNYKDSVEENSLQKDELTGLLRRAPFIRQVEYLVTNKRGFTFMMLDLDDFKSINDIYGHSVGDDVLRYVADVLYKTLRTSDIICRIGGDEFAVALVDACDEKIVSEITYRIRTTLKEQSVLPDDRCMIKLSFGARLHLAKNGTPSFQELYTEADAALYEAKRAGKDRLKFVK